MDHSPSIITQVSREEEENATCREEGEFGGKKFYCTAELRMTVSAGRDGTEVLSRLRGVTEPGRRCPDEPTASLSKKRVFSYTAINS